MSFWDKLFKKKKVVRYGTYACELGVLSTTGQLRNTISIQTKVEILRDIDDVEIPAYGVTHIEVLSPKDGFNTEVMESILRNSPKVISKDKIKLL